ncbi:MAG: hypothetical protein AAGG72_01835 [Pseudomonadota bacterium]
MSIAAYQTPYGPLRLGAEFKKTLLAQQGPVSNAADDREIQIMQQLAFNAYNSGNWEALQSIFEYEHTPDDVVCALDRSMTPNQIVVLVECATSSSPGANLGAYRWTSKTTQRDLGRFRENGLIDDQNFATAAGKKLLEKLCATPLTSDAQ